MDNTPLICVKCNVEETQHVGFGFDHSFTLQVNKGGRPTILTYELANEICNRLANGESMRKVCLDDNMPNKSSVFEWIRAHKWFADQYAKAKEESVDALSEETLEIADESIDDAYKADPKAAGAAVNAQRLRVDTRKWFLSKVKPKKYGDRVATDITSNGETIKGNSIIFNNFDELK